MKKRVLSGVGICLAFVLIFLASQLLLWGYTILITALLSIAVYEMAKATKTEEAAADLPYLYIYTIGFGVLNICIQCFGRVQYYGVYLLAYFLSAFALEWVLLTIAQKNRKVIKKTFFIMLDPSILFFAWMCCMYLNQYSAIALMAILLISPICDTFALLVGMTLKGKKLCPKISPNKTVSGAIGGICGGVLASILLYFLFEKWGFFGQRLDFVSMPIIVYLILGVVGSILTEIGDLFASAVKRKYQIKDYGNLIPGHGGVMDRFDGIIFNATFVYVFFALLMYFVA